MAGGDNENGIYPYNPNRIVCIGAAILFGTSALYHLYSMILKKTWFYSALVVGSMMMTIGYIARYFSAKEPSQMMPYVMQSLFIILPPSLYAATIYMIYGRIVLFVNAPKASLIRPTRVTKVFVIGDVFAFLMQAGGGGMMVQESLSHLGQKIMLLGLFIQLAFFGLFLVISLVFWKRMRSSPSKYTIPIYGKHAWDALLKLLFYAAALIILRCIYRIIEFSQGYTGYLASHEVFLYLFDALPMLVVQVMFHFVHAGDVFPRGTTMEKLAHQGESAISLQERV